MLMLTQTQQVKLETAAIAAYPRECCGILLGMLEQGSSETVKQVTQICPTDNAWTPEIEAEFLAAAPSPIPSDADGAPHRLAHGAHSQHDRFWIDPRELLKAQKQARSRGWVVVGIYHSHPDHPAVPSERDRQSAWPDYSYVILSISGKNNGASPPYITDSSSWVLDSESQFQREALQPPEL